jgi:serine/threonine-protein kinase
VADEARVEQLLDEILDAERTPEEVCAACPELLPEVRRRWEKMRLLEAELEALFPTTGPQSGASATASVPAGAELPSIPGYEVQDLLGRGGMGAVYKARHLGLNRTVAVKMLLAGAYAADHERARFQREAEAVAGLRHGNIVQVYDVGEHEGRPYFTMELIEGGSLRQKLAHTPQPARPAAALAATLAEAVQVAHEGGIVHRDLTPANVLLTPDGTPKISDFGLARRLADADALTQSGATLGTPGYMAPEQAGGKTRAIGPATDVYALGTILYEMLTGRPPFRGETTAETLLQVLYEEPVPPSRLHAKVPRDLETICLKCLHKDPQRRYATAAALADDLRRFGRGEPIAARPAGLLERTGKWVRRHPGRSALLAAGLLVALALAGASQWLAVQQANQRHAVQTDLDEVTRLQDSARWQEAWVALNRAQARLGGGPDDLRRRLGQARRDLDLVMKLDAIRLRRATRGELLFYKVQADQQYQAAFAEAGLGTAHDHPARVAALVKASPVHGALVAALDDWAVCVTDKDQRDWLLDVARQADPDPDGWRQRIRDPAAWEDPAALAELARTVPASQPVSVLLALGERLWVARGHAAPFLRRVQKEHPADFWANLILGNALLQWAPQEAGGYYRAALASRPQAAVGYCAVGDALRLQNNAEEAIDYYDKALQIDQGYARAHSNLGLTWYSQGRLDEAIDCCRTALRLDPDYAWAHHNLANALRDKGRLEEASAEYREVIRLDPKNLEVQSGIRSVLIRQGRGHDAQARWRQALDANPPELEAWHGYAELCLFLGMQDEYRRARRILLDRFGATTSPFVAEPVGRACLLLPGTQEELRQAADLADLAAAAKGSTEAWIYRYFLFAKGLAEYRQGRPGGAASLMEGEASGVLGPAPRLVLALAQHAGGKTRQARKTLASAVAAFDWSSALADTREVWICHVLRRQAEALILPNLAALLRGEAQPRDNDERLALAGPCQFQGLYHAAARHYADAFATDPTLVEALTSECLNRAALGDRQPVGGVEEMTTRCRYPAARCAALAGCGAGKDGAGLSDTERAHWREQARAWLRADLAVWARALDSGSRAARVLVRKVLTHWQDDPDLAGLREAKALDGLSAAERTECLTLWRQVGDLLKRARELK